MQRKPLVILTGPTASGKTQLSINLAKRINGEIISADSMQVYKKMNIGTAKITKDEMQGVPHHLIDVLMPDQEFNVVVFQQMAKTAMEEIIAKGKIPIIVGGTGFYIQALLNDIDFTQNDSDMSFRHQLEEIAKDQGPEVLHQRLAECDPKSAVKIHANNIKRVIRALEFYEKTGQKISDHNEEQMEKDSPYNFAYFVIQMSREILYERINKRVDKMIEEGLVQEVHGLLSEGYDPQLVSMQGLGYKEFVPYFNNQCSLDESIYILKRDTRHFAKRQITWFKREKEVFSLDKQENTEDELLEIMINELKKRGIYND